MIQKYALAAAVFLAACASPKPPGLNDGGQIVDAGQDAGLVPDAGLPASYECNPFAVGACDAGFCAEGNLPDGGFGATCNAGCDVVAQDCGAAFKCEYVNGVRSCLDGGTLPEGSNCLGNTGACVAGSMCTLMAGGDGGTEGTCRKFCRTNADCPATKICNLIVTVNGTGEKPRVCGEAPQGCDVFTQNCPLSTQGCYPTSSSGPVCLTSGITTLGSPCAAANSCVKGTVCAGPVGDLKCRSVCPYPSTGACTSGTCTRLTATPDAGVCQ